MDSTSLNDDLPFALLLSSLALATLGAFVSPTLSMIKTRPWILSTRFFCRIFLAMVFFLNSTKAILLKNKEISFSFFQFCTSDTCILGVIFKWTVMQVFKTLTLCLDFRLHQETWRRWPCGRVSGCLVLLCCRGRSSETNIWRLWLQKTGQSSSQTISPQQSPLTLSSFTFQDHHTII